MSKEKQTEREELPVEAVETAVPALEDVKITKSDLKAGFVTANNGEQIRIGAPPRYMVTGSLADPSQFAAPAPEPYVDSPEEAKRAEDAKRAATLAGPNPCTFDETCGLEYAPWSNRAHWACEKCGYAGFDQEEATARKPSVQTK